MTPSELKALQWLLDNKYKPLALPEGQVRWYIDVPRSREYFRNEGHHFLLPPEVYHALEYPKLMDWRTGMAYPWFSTEEEAMEAAAKAMVRSAPLKHMIELIEQAEKI